MGHEVSALLEAMNKLTVELAEFRRLHQTKRKPELTPVQHLEAILRDAGTPLSVSDLAARSGSQEGTIRMILYTHTDKFIPMRLSPRRVRWGIAGMASPRVSQSGMPEPTAMALAGTA